MANYNAASLDASSYLLVVSLKPSIRAIPSDKIDLSSFYNDIFYLYPQFYGLPNIRETFTYYQAHVLELPFDMRPEYGQLYPRKL